MEGRDLGRRCSLARTKRTNPGMTRQMGICTRPCVCLADLVEIRIPDTVSARMLQIKARGRKLNCQTGEEGGRGHCILCWGSACANVTLNGTHSGPRRETFSLCAPVIGMMYCWEEQPVFRSGIYTEDKLAEQRLKMMISLINNSNDITAGQGRRSCTRKGIISVYL